MAQDFKTRFDINLPAVPSASDRELHRELLIVYNSIRLLSSALEKRNSFPIVFETTIGLNVLVSITDVAGVATARVASYGVNEAHGFVSVPATAGNVGEITLVGYSDNPLSTAPAGTKLWLGVNGLWVTTNPGAGSQRVGYKMSAVRTWISPVLIP